MPSEKPTKRCQECGLLEKACCCGEDAEREMEIEDATEWGDEPFGNR